MLNDDVLADAAVARVRRWLDTPHTRRDPSAERLAALLQDPEGLQFAIDFVDRVIRPDDAEAAGREFAQLARKAPKFLGLPLKTAVRVGGLASSVLPKATVPAARKAMRQLLSHLVIDATDKRLGKHLARLKARDVQLNVNLLGEAVLGQHQADIRLHGTERLLRRDDVDYVSIKVSSVVPQLNMWAFDETVAEVAKRLTPLYRIAAKQGKFINLDMEEYRDFDLTLAVFETLLTAPEFHNLHAGIVIQAYLPDALGAIQRLTKFAHERVAAGGAPIKVRLVKGANLAMERVDAAIHGWDLVTCSSKEATDANYKRVLQYALRPESASAMRLGVAGHNLFDLAYALELASHYGTTDALDVEMLLGMAEEHLDAVRADLPRIVLYTPVVHPADFDSAVAYLIRRLEENGSQENFMSAMFRLDDASLFAREERRFRGSLALMAAQDADGAPRPNRRQNRETDSGRPTPEQFINEPDTDPSLSCNRAWARGIIDRVAGSRLGCELVAASHRIADPAALLDEAVSAAPGWAQLGGEGRRRVLYRCADELARRRGELIEVMASETGKTLAEGDVEVSEAIDFCRFYADQALELEREDGATPHPVALTVVVPPWNFPCAIPCGGTVAALATGSSVVLKPAPQAERTAAVLVEALWEAGVPREVLQFAAVGESDVARTIMTDERVGRLIFTGSSETASLFGSWRPELTILGETSGKNAIIVLPDADLDLAASDLVKSAFGHAGQKCSAASLGILVGSIGTSKRFLDQVLDAVRTLRVGYPQDPSVHVGPIIEPASGKLQRALTQLEPGERWLLEPKKLDAEGRLWQPGVRAGVRPGSYTHLTEFFGSHLSLINVTTLDEAIAVQNGTDFGLTAGIHSLDPHAVRHWLDKVEAGNCYVNRGITGAIVRRQPFGGWKASQAGPGAKAGGPNYLATLVDWEAPHYATDAMFLRAAQDDDLRVWESEFGIAADVSGLGVERNVLRYRPTREVLVRVADDARDVDLQRVLSAIVRTGSTVALSTHVPLATGGSGMACIASCVVESDEEFHRRLTAPAFFDPAEGMGRIRRIRLIGHDAQLQRLLGGDASVAVYDQPVTASGRLEMLPFLREQAVSITAHRYGNPDPRFTNLRL